MSPDRRVCVRLTTQSNGRPTRIRPALILQPRVEDLNGLWCRWRHQGNGWLNWLCSCRCFSNLWICPLTPQAPTSGSILEVTDTCNETPRECVKKVTVNPEAQLQGGWTSCKSKDGEMTQRSLDRLLDITPVSGFWLLRYQQHIVFIANYWKGKIILKLSRMNTKHRRALLRL